MSGGERKAEPLGPLHFEIAMVCDQIKKLLQQKNQAYGNSALQPMRVFSKASPIEQILVRIDDKLSRLAKGSAAGEDVELDLIGYLVLLRIARLKEKGMVGVTVGTDPGHDDYDCPRGPMSRTLPETLFIGVSTNGNLYPYSSLREAIADGSIDVASYSKQKAPKTARPVKYYLVQESESRYLCVDYQGQNCFAGRSFAFRFSPEEHVLARMAAVECKGAVKVVYEKDPA